MATEALKLDPQYSKAILRRAQANEKMDTYSSLSDALEDYRTLAKQPDLDTHTKNECQRANKRLPPIIKEKMEKEKEEMMGKLKDLGNTLLGKFGLSTDNFQMQQDPSTGSYSVNFVQRWKRYPNAATFCTTITMHTFGVTGWQQGGEETDGLCKGKKTTCYSQDHVLQQMTTLHVIKITTCVFIQAYPTTDMDIDKTAKAFGEWGKRKMTATHKRRGTCTEAVGLIRLSFPLSHFIIGGQSKGSNLDKRYGQAHPLQQWDMWGERSQTSRSKTHNKWLFLGMGWHWFFCSFTPKGQRFKQRQALPRRNGRPKPWRDGLSLFFWFYLFLFFVGGRKKRTSKGWKKFSFTFLYHLFYTLFTSHHTLHPLVAHKVKQESDTILVNGKC